MKVLINIDVADLAKAERFYTEAFGLKVGRRFEGGSVELLDAAVARARAAGATLEQDVATHAWGRIATFADPFGNGFCLLQFSAAGYDAIAL